jgi:hypothetical protein
VEREVKDAGAAGALPARASRLRASLQAAGFERIDIDLPTPHRLSVSAAFAETGDPTALLGGSCAWRWRRPPSH